MVCYQIIGIIHRIQEVNAMNELILELEELLESLERKQISDRMAIVAVVVPLFLFISVVLTIIAFN